METIEEQLKEALEALSYEQKVHAETKEKLDQALQELVDTKGFAELAKQELEDYKIEAEARLLKEKSRNPNPKVEVEHEGAKYLFAHPKVNRAGLIISAEEAAKDAEFIASLLAIEGQSILVEDK